jgi:murein DD-endopeptidase MepM/ murein hydrolase activator NlpD
MKKNLKRKRNKEYSTLMIVNKNNPNTKSFNIPSKHIFRLKYYVISLGIILVGMVISIFILTSKYKKNEHARQELERFKREIAGPLATDTNIARIYIEKIDDKLVRIKKYLKQRGVKHSYFKLGGDENTPVSGIDSYKYYNVFLASLLKDLKYMPLGYPHRNHNNSKFGYRSNPFHGHNSEFHSGVDIRGNTGDDIKSTANGVVVLASWYSGYGNCVKIKHAHGYQTLYGHLSRISVKNGQKIKANQKIGELGSTGRSTGPHLHYEVRYQDRPINPAKFLDL